MNNTDQNSIEKNNRILLEVPSWIKDDVVRWISRCMSIIDNIYDNSSNLDRTIKIIPNTYNFDILNRFNILCERESKDNIIDYKTIKKYKGLYDIRSLDFKILDASELDSKSLFYIDGKLCCWRKTGGGEIVEIKSEDNLNDIIKYDKRSKMILTAMWVIISTLNAFVLFSHYFIK